MLEFTAENKNKIADLLTRYPTKQAALLPVLWVAQDQFKTLTNDILELVATTLSLSPVHVYSVASFYTMYNLKPVGKYNIQMCRTLSCALNGSENILEYIKQKLKVEEGQTTPDGKFSVCGVECLASCGTAPTMMINEAYYENLTEAKVDQILANLK